MKQGWIVMVIVAVIVVLIAAIYVRKRNETTMAQRKKKTKDKERARKQRKINEKKAKKQKQKQVEEVFVEENKIQEEDLSQPKIDENGYLEVKVTEEELKRLQKIRKEEQEQREKQRAVEVKKEFEEEFAIDYDEIPDFDYLYYLEDAFDDTRNPYYAEDREYYEESLYYALTKHPFLDVIHHKGMMGEYLCYEALMEFERDSIFLFNVYLPKKNDDLIEIDMILITKYGIFVIESKNYAGILSGNDEDEQWNQLLPSKDLVMQNHLFYNPIHQNDYHLEILRQVIEKRIGRYYNYHSIIAFSDRCNTEGITYKKGEAVTVCQYKDLRKCVSDAIMDAKLKGVKRMSDTEMDFIYEVLEPYTRDELAKQYAHIRKFYNEDYNK